jgi:hypothetical protein
LRALECRRFGLGITLLLVLASLAVAHNASPNKVGFYGHSARKSIVS